MKQYLIEWEIPDAGAFPEETLKDISKRSNGILDAMRSEGSEIEWVYTVTPRVTRFLR